MCIDGAAVGKMWLCIDISANMSNWGCIGETDLRAREHISPLHTLSSLLSHQGAGMLNQQPLNLGRLRLCGMTTVWGLLSLCHEFGSLLHPHSQGYAVPWLLVASTPTQTPRYHKQQRHYKASTMRVQDTAEGLPHHAEEGCLNMGTLARGMTFDLHIDTSRCSSYTAVHPYAHMHRLNHACGHRQI